MQVINSTKYHAETAGEGIEFSWGVAKSTYRKIPIGLKKGKDKFHELVRKCLSVENVLTVENIRRFSIRARCYMKAYYALGMNSKLLSATNDKDDKSLEEGDNYCSTNEYDHTLLHGPITYIKIEKLAKEFRTHHSALDFDHGFIKGITNRK